MNVKRQKTVDNRATKQMSEISDNGQIFLWIVSGSSTAHTGLILVLLYVL